MAEEIGAGTVLVEIRNMLRRYDRRHRQDDFSITRLVGTLAQMLALVSGAWGLAALYSTHSRFVGGDSQVIAGDFVPVAGYDRFPDWIKKVTVQYF